MAARSLGSLTLDLVLKTGNFLGPMDRAQRDTERNMRRMRSDAKKAAAGIAAVAGAATAAAAGIYAYAKSNMDTIDANAKLARSLDGTIDGLRAVQMEASDSGIDGLEKSLARMNRRLGAVEMSGGPALKTVERLNLDLQAMQDMDVDEKLGYIADQIQASGMSSQEAARHLQQLGFEQKNASQLFMAGGDAIRSSRQEIEDYGLSVSMLDAAKIEEANDALSRIGLSAESMGNAVAIKLAPALNDMADSINAVTRAFNAGEYDLQLQILSTMAMGVTGAAVAYGTYRTAVNLATIAQYAFNTAVRVNPLGAAVTVIGAAAGALFTFREELGLVSPEVETATDRVDGLTDSLDLNSAAALKNAKAMLEAEEQLNRFNAASLAVQVAQQRQVVYDEQEQWDAIGGQQAFGMGPKSESQERLHELEVSLNQARLAGDSAAEAIGNVNQKLGELKERGDGSGSGSPGDDDNTPPGSGSGSGSARDVAIIDEQADAYSRLIDQLYPLQATQRQFREEMELLEAANAAGAIDDIAEAQQRLRESYQSDQNFQDAYDLTGMGKQSEDGGYWESWLEGAEEAFTSFDELAGSVVENFSGRFGDAFESMIFDAESLGDAVHGMAEGMARSVVNSLGEMAAQWLAYQAVQMLVGQTTQGSAAATMSANAAAQSAMAGLNAFTSTAAIPIVGPALAPAAAATATAVTAPMAATVATLAASGMAHDGIDSVPETGTWLLEKGERVTTADTSAKLDATLARVEGQMNRPGDSGGNITVNLMESSSKAGQVDKRQNDDGSASVTVFVADIRGGGQRAKVLEQTYGLKRQGR